MDTVIVLIAGIAAIIFTYWFFFMKKSHIVEAGEQIDIIVNGGYKPDTISLAAGKPTTLRFMRTDPSSCLEEVVIADLKIRKFLPLNQMVEIPVSPATPGEYPFSCGMNMFHGKIIAH